MFDLLKIFVNQTSMYRLMLYLLLVILFSAIILSLSGFLYYDGVNLLLAGLFLLFICNSSNYFIAKLFGAKVNLESASITALILTLIVGPLPLENLPNLAGLGLFAMTSKYLLVWHKRHIFNPVAIGVLLSSLIFQTGASWWAGNIYTLPIILAGGIIINYKIHRFAIVTSFLSVLLLTLLISGNFADITRFFLFSPVWFFALVMLVEPLTSPSNKKLQIAYGAIVALAFVSIQRFLPTFPYSLETSLIIGNVFSFLLNPSFNLTFNFVKKIEVVKNTWAFYFEPMSKFSFHPGQYLEWTYPHYMPDPRGVRRYFTIASSPTDRQVMIAMRVSPNSSSFKKALLGTKEGGQIVASGPQGEFVLPKDKLTPLCFIAGGIGITPFLSMVKYMTDIKEKRDIVLLYANNTKEDVVFRGILDAGESAGVKTVYIITKKDGFVNKEMIQQKVPDFKERLFFISGPEPMVGAFKKMLLKMKVKGIKTDYFPGYSETFQK